ncbi:MAG: right-handed parallel beta-helix repeat-containing protein [Kofleriaceae bacterium]|nr:right-handed parallel beta-helix repeat-containing protein [Kofleriaceae bacterium]
MHSYSSISKTVLVLASSLYLACTRPDALFCESSTDCTDPARSFCDVGGAFAASDGVGNTCIVDPSGVPPVDAGPGDPDAAIVVPDATVQCTVSGDCSASLPICSDDMCEACTFGTAGDSDCQLRDNTAPFCHSNGTCRECISDSGCSGNAPVCDDSGVCGACVDDDECASGACGDVGSCVPTGSIVYVDSAGQDSNTCGNSQASACKNLSGLQGAIAKVASGKTHLVMAPGTYTEPQLVVFVGKTVKVVGHGAQIVAPSLNGPALAVGFSSDLVLSDVTILGGTGGVVGAGIDCTGANLRLVNVVVSGSEASGIDALNCELRVENSEISNHSAEGMTISGGTVTLLDTKIEDNGKRGAYLLNSVLHVERSRFFSNTLGGLRIENSSFHMESTEVVNNGNLMSGEVTRRTGGIVIRNGVSALSPQELFHCTVAGNVSPNFDIASAGVDCGVIPLLNTVDINSSIVVGNRKNNMASSPVQVTSSCQVRFSAVTGIGENMGNISELPDFVGSVGGNYHLNVGSPGTGAADPSSTVTTDIDGDVRPATGKDMGSDEV